MSELVLMHSSKIDTGRRQLLDESNRMCVLRKFKKVELLILQVLKPENMRNDFVFFFKCTLG